MIVLEFLAYCWSRRGEFIRGWVLFTLMANAVAMLVIGLLS